MLVLTLKVKQLCVRPLCKTERVFFSAFCVSGRLNPTPSLDHSAAAGKKLGKLMISVRVCGSVKPVSVLIQHGEEYTRTQKLLSVFGA